LVLYQIISFLIGKIFFLFKKNFISIFIYYRNAPAHVQPFVLVQFKNLPLNRLISVTCRAWAPGIEHDTKGMRGMVVFQLYRSHSYEKPKKDLY
jgi:hypothetical protein